MHRESQFKMAARAFVVLIQIVSLVYIVNVIRQNNAEFSSLNLSIASIFFPLFISFVILVVANFASMFGYSILLGAIATDPPMWHDVAIMHGRTVLAKYLPGNIFQFVGRQLVGKEKGWSQFSLAAATLLEILLIVSSASAFTLVFGSMATITYFSWLPEEFSDIFLVVGFFGPLLLILLYGKVNLPFVKKYNLPSRVVFEITKLFAAGLSYFSFILLSGGVFVYLRIAQFDSINLHTAAAFAAAFGLSFLVGFVTPGAPGGLGVREALLVLFLSSISTPATVAATALMHRISAIAAEIFFALIMVPILKKRRTPV